MALIPYQHLPPPHDPPIVVAGQPLAEYYCGDARCDCATAHVLFSGVPFAVDLGTTRVDLLDPQNNTPNRQALEQKLRKTLQEGAIATLRRHYALVRDFGREQHFRYVDWTNLKPGDLVAWEQVFRTESTPMWTMAPSHLDESNAEEVAKKSFLLGLGDAYCIEPRCDCQRVVWSVVTAKSGQANRAQTLGTVELPFASLHPKVLRQAPGIDPNQLFTLVYNLLRGQPQLVDMYKQRYALFRQHLSPLLQAQRQEKSTARQKTAMGRNNLCPCGSGKKYKKCHGS